MIVKVSGDNVGAIIESFKNGLRDMSDLLERIGDNVIFPSIQKNFDVEGRPKWKELAPRTQLERASQGFAPAHPILQRTGELMRTSATKQGAYTDLDRTRYMISPLLRWSEWLNEGVGKLPAREFFMLQPEDYPKVGEVANKWFVNEIQKAIMANKITDLEAMLR